MTKRLSGQFWYLLQAEIQISSKIFPAQSEANNGSCLTFFFPLRLIQWKSESRVLAANTQENMKSKSPQRFN